MKRPVPRVLLLLTLLVACALRVFRLGYQELRGDEAFNYFFGQNSVAELIRQTIDIREPHPIGSYVIEKAWWAVAGHSEFALRFLSIWFGVLAVALLYALGRRLRLSSAAAGLGAALLALSPYAVWHSQDARMYSMLLALTTASTWLALLASEDGGIVRWLAYVVATWLALHVHYSAFFVVLVQNLFVLATAWRDKTARRALAWLGSQVAVALAYAPWAWIVSHNLSGYGGNGESPGLVPMVYRSLSVFAAGEPVPDRLRPWCALIAALLLLWGLGQLVRAGRTRSAWLLALYLFVTLGAVWVTGLIRPLFNERYLVVSVPPFYLLVAAGAAGLARRFGVREPAGGASTESPDQPKRGPGAVSTVLWLAALLVLVVAALGSLYRYYVDPAYSRTRGWRALAAEIRRFSRGLPPEQARIAENYPDPTLWYYYTGPIDHTVLPPSARDAEGAAADVDRLAAGDVQWVILPVQASEAWDPDGMAATALAQRYTLVAEEHVADWPLRVYARPGAAGLQTVEATFTDGLTLRGAGVAPKTALAGGLVAVHLSWAGDARGLKGTEKLFVHIADAQNRPAAQVDSLLGPGQLAAPAVTYGIPLPAALAPGTYNVLVGLYDPAQPGAPRVLTTEGQDHVRVGELVVAADR